jgi:hypothetical protein
MQFIALFSKEQGLTYNFILEGSLLHQEKKNLLTIFRLSARAIGTCLVLLAAA